jgi:hypothetical protein
MKKFKCGLVGRCNIESTHDHPIYGKIKVVKIICSMFIGGRIEHIVIAIKEAQDND